MYETPTPVWNEIAATQEMSSARWEKLFQAEDLVKALKPLENELEALGADARTTRAYLLVAPLLFENLAISRFVEQQGRQSLRSSMPELLTVKEATTLASQEFSLTPGQQDRLRGLLLRGPALQKSGQPSAQQSR